MRSHGYRAPHLCGFCRSGTGDQSLPLVDVWRRADLPRARRGTLLASAPMMPPIRAALPFALSFMLLSRWAAADEVECRLRGQVADIQNGGAVEGARVLVSDKSGLRGSTVTNRGGFYVVLVP